MRRSALILVLAVATMAVPAQAAAPMTWQVEKLRDAATGLRSCHVRSLGGHVTAVLAEASPSASPAWSVRIGFDNRPGSLRYLRVGRSIHQTDAASFRGPEAKAIVERLKAPGEFVFEWELGSGANKQGGLFLTGDFAEKAAVCEDWIAGRRARNVRTAPNFGLSGPSSGYGSAASIAPLMPRVPGLRRWPASP